MTIQNISFTKTDIEGIQGLLFEEKTSNLVEGISPEIEVRFGSVGVSKYGKPFFNTNVELDRFNQLVNKLKAQKKYLSYNFTIDTVFYKGRLRRIVSSSNETIQHKIKSSDKDLEIVSSFKKIRNSYIPIKDTIRISKSYEKEIDISEWKSSSDPEDTSVVRERHSFKMEHFTIDITHKTYNNGRKTYEIEGEFNSTFADDIIKKGKSSFKDFMVQIKNILNEVYSNIKSICSSSYFVPIQTKIEELSRKMPNENKPKNINDDNVLKTQMKNYSVTNKLDGVGYNLIFVKQLLENTPFITLVAFNGTDVWRVATIKESSIEKNEDIIKSLSNVEIRESVNNSFEIHFFDTLLFGNSDMYKTHLENRLNSSKKVCDYCIKYFSSAQISFEVKRFFNTGDTLNDIITTLDYMNTRYDVDKLIDYNDGIIFQPNGGYNESHILKWKFPSKVTIDFLLKKKSVNNNVIIYDLYTKTGEDKYEQFVDVHTNTKHSIEINDTDIIDGISATELEDKVVELGMEYGVWIIHRIRFDKTKEKVNFVKVANDTFLDIIYEFSLPYLVNLIKYSRNTSLQRPQKEFRFIESSKKEEEKIYVQEEIKEDIFEVKDANIQWLFPSTDKVKGQRITNIGLKNITRPKDAKIISEYISNKYYEYFKKRPRDLTITDAMAGVGGNTFSFSRTFKIVNSIEINPLTIEILQHNTYLYQMRNITYFQDSFFNVVNNTQQNIIYIDVGKDDIIEGKSLSEIVDELKPYANMIVLKVSQHTNISHIVFNDIEDMKYYKLLVITPSVESKKEEKGMMNLRRVANKIKEQYIELSKDKIVVDIGSGVGGDIFKYEKVKPKELYFIEPSESNIKNMESRLLVNKEQLPHLTNVLKYLNAGGEDTEEIVNFVNKKVDVVNMFFSLTFFFKDKEMLMKLVDTIDQLLNTDGTLIISVMYGDDLITELKQRDGVIENEDYTIKLLHESNLNVSGNTPFGTKINIDLKGTKTATSQDEYLVFQDTLQYYLSTRNISLQKTLYFSKLGKGDLTDNEYNLIRHYATYTFKKNNVITETSFNSLFPLKNSVGIINENWYRVPTPNDNWNLIHILKPITKDEVEIPIKGSDSLLQITNDALSFRNRLAENFTLNDFNLMKSSIRKTHEFMSKMSLSCFSKVNKFTQEEYIELMKELSPYSFNTVLEYTTEVKNRLVNVGFDEEDVDYVIKGVVLNLYLNYSDKLSSNSTVKVDNSVFELLKMKLKINIIVIDSNTRNINREETGDINSDLLSLVILLLNNGGYETMEKDNKSIFSYDEIRILKE
jgi:SAM-dependent methyltransferase